MDDSIINKPQQERYYQYKGYKVSQSTFNPKWCKEVGLKPEIIFDIGSCDLGDAIRLKECFNCSTYAFEASPKRFEYCQKISELCDIPVYNYIVCDRSDEMIFYESHDSIQKEAGAQGSIFKHSDVYKKRHGHIAQKDGIKVQAKTLIEICDEIGKEPDLIHMDVERAELYVIKGMGSIRPKMIFLETLEDAFWQEAPSNQELYDYMDSIGYKLLLNTGADKLYGLK